MCGTQSWVDINTRSFGDTTGSYTSDDKLNSCSERYTRCRHLSPPWTYSTLIGSMIISSKKIVWLSTVFSSFALDEMNVE